MTFVTDVKDSLKEILSYGEQIRFKYYNTSFGAGSYYDDNVTYTQSGNDYWTTGLLLPLNTRYGSREALLLQQGKLQIEDKKLYIDSVVQTSGLAPIKIGTTGSPTTRQYEILEQGQVTEWDINGSPIYKRAYVRFIPNGSFLGE